MRASVEQPAWFGSAWSISVVNIHAAKTQLSRLVEDAKQGEKVVIAKAGKPMPRLLPIEQAREPR